MTVVDITILSAGASKRLGQPKHLVAHPMGTLLQRQIALALSLHSRVRVVLAQGDHRGQGICQQMGVEALINPDARQGLSSSIKTAMAAVDNPEQAQLLMLVDQYRLMPEDLTQLIQWYLRHQTSVASCYEEIKGAPALFAPKEQVHLLQLQGDRGAGALISRLGLPTLSCQRAAWDLDTPEDLANYRSHHDFFHSQWQAS